MTWSVRPLEDVAETALGKMLDKGKPKGLPHVPYLRNVNVQWGRIDTDDLLTMELSDEDRDRFAVREGDLLVCEGGEIGRCAIWHGRTEYLAYQKALHRVRPTDVLDRHFLRYLLEHHAQSGTLAKLSTGSTISHLPQQQLRRVPVPLPSLDEQRRIVDLLEDHLSRVDVAHRELSTCEARSVALQESWLRQHLTPRIDDGLTRVGDSLTDVRGGWSRSSKHIVVAGGVPYLKMNNITRRGRLDLSSLVCVDATASEIEKYGAQPGDVLFNSKNSGDLVGKTSVADHRVAGSVINENIMRLRFNERVEPSFAAMWFLGHQMRSAIMGAASASTNVAAVYQNQLLEFPMWTPSIRKQRELVDAFEEVRDASERMTIEALRLVQRGEALRRSLLAAAFSGRLTGERLDHDPEKEAVG